MTQIICYDVRTVNNITLSHCNFEGTMQCFGAIKGYNEIKRNVHMQYMHKDGVIYRVKPVNKADTNVIN